MKDGAVTDMNNVEHLLDKIFLDQNVVRHTMKISYLLMTAFVMVSMFDGASFALSWNKKMPRMQPPLVQPQAEKRVSTEQAIALKDWVRLSSKFYKLRQHFQ